MDQYPFTGRSGEHRARSGRLSGSRRFSRPIVLLLVSAVPILYSIWVMAVVALTGDIGLNCVLGTVVKESISEDFVWSPGRPEVGDQIVAIGGRPIPYYPAYVAAMRDIRDRRGSSVEVVWMPKDGRAPRRSVAVVANRPLRAYLWSLLWFFQEMAIFGVGAYVFGKRPLMTPRPGCSSGSAW